MATAVRFQAIPKILFDILHPTVLAKNINIAHRATSAHHSLPLGRALATWLMLLVSTLMLAQVDSDSTTLAPHTGIDPEAEALFRKLMPQHDTTFVALSRRKDTLGKRFSFHFNLLDWATTLPSVGVEFDLNKTERNNRSIMFVGKFNDVGHLNFTQKLTYNVMAARVEFRKYWRTGGIGKNRNNHQYERIRLKHPKMLTRTEYDYENYDSIARTVRYYANAEDSLKAERYNGDPNRGWFYNHYHKFRRNFTSSRTIREPRNWRAYYLGAYAGADKYDILFNKKGRKGSGLFAGMTLGWSIPVLTQRFPNEGGLDLDLGALVGVKAVKYDAYRYESPTQPYTMLPADSKTQWSLVKFPVVQELRLSLVYRLRSISRKVSLALVDDYEDKWVDPYRSRKEDTERAITDRETERNTAMLQQRHMAEAAADSTSFWNHWHERRLRNAMQINPDTTFLGEDKVLYEKIINKPILDKMDKDQLKAYYKQQAAEQKAAAKQQAAEQKAAAKKEAAAQKEAATTKKKKAKKND